MKNSFTSNDSKYLLTVFILLVIEYYLTIDIPFFWDATSKALRAGWIYENNFGSLIVPSDMNSGHPPLWITSLALTWKILGQSLWASRMLLLLINIGVFYQLFRLVKSLFDENVPLILFFFICLEPTLLAQTTSLNNDMLLLFFTLLGCNALLKNKFLLLTIALVGALLTNLRGIYVFIALGICHFILNKNHYLNYSKKQLYPYLIGIVLFLIFAIYQYSEIGWAIITKQRNYSQHREVASFQTIFKNALAYLKFYLDFGRIFIVFPTCILLWKYRNSSLNFNKATHKTFLLLVVFVIVFFFGIVPFSNPSGPRYVMISYLLVMILFVNLLYDEVRQVNIKKWLIPLACIGLITGHFWIYPPKIAQAWDSSFAYLNFFPVERKMQNYIDTNNFKRIQIATYLRENINDPANTKVKTKVFHIPNPDLDKNKYMLMSNVENSMDDATMDTVLNSWVLKQKFSQLGVYMALYENPNY
ncbi:ArnT family glycosyltransferase [Aequorivita capsosiphonis]|uniref:ArnT family glycosyltransferase n=1 Tax=Aequorivita capsosiphonis TaxID=487317 RepID=UPI000417AAA1|nr:glycosyltransferase family 39 protein [Aequorivita capsosiphonis]